MSGQPNRYASDPADFREEYMKQLGLRASLDDMNLQANKIYKSTGALPPQSTMADTRTASEVLADVEKLKVSLISALKPVADASFANVIVQGIQSSPLNADGSFFTWFYQNIDTIVPLLKKKYKVGIKGDKNDAEVFIAFMADAYSKNREMSGSIKEYFDRPTSSLVGNISPGDIDGLIKVYDDIYRRLSLVNIGTVAQEIGTRFNSIRTLIRTPAYNDIKNFIAANNVMELATFNEPIYVAYKALEEYLKLLPVPSTIKTLISQVEKASINKDKVLTEKILTSINEMLPSPTETSRVKSLLERIPRTPRVPVAPAIAVRPAFPPTPFDPNAASPGTVSANYSPTVPSPPQPATPDTVLTRKYLTSLGSIIYEETIDTISNDDTLTIPEVIATVDKAVYDFIKIMDRQEPTWKTESGINMTAIEKALKDSVRSIRASYDKHNLLPEDQIVRAFLYNMKNSGVKGNGIKKRRGRPKGSGVAIKDRIDTTKGIKPTKHYIPFGRYLINSHKLRDDIVAMKSMSGSNIKEYPSSKVSTKLGKVIKVIVGGGVPSYKDLEDLSEEEKNYLSKVAKKAQIDDKLSIPSPSKDKQEKDIHQFEVMKGEIMSGNDSKDMIKEFKVLILRLSKTGALPKRDVMEIMTELIQLGY